jgi:predicted HAD superfamily phosphohydrolase YqeG
VVGKPAAAFFAAALAHLGADAAHTLMVGDDIENDVLAAQRQGLTGALVKTRQRHARPRPRLLRRPAGPAGATVLRAPPRSRLTFAIGDPRPSAAGDLTDY